MAGHSHGTTKSLTSDDPSDIKVLEIHIRDREKEAEKNSELEHK